MAIFGFKKSAFSSGLPLLFRLVFAKIFKHKNIHVKIKQPCQ